ncbi:uncharacterized protein LOC133823872 isoform X2 [Humulus lupulus]|uniref:uncharacterized protein LOC133823872 isoform X2 n=1 Tax=Humulus lupulus TaxID=3486 RepID=UPI002B413854|nr:uncharacterized protein LOC133823872 isoform X2 [Humulus lupulus]
MYSLNEVWDGIVVQYRMNYYRDLSRLTSTYMEGTPPASSEYGEISWSPSTSTSSGESSSTMDSDLDTVLVSGEGAKRSRRPRASQKSDRPAKVLKRTEKNPPPLAPTVTSPAMDLTPQVEASTTGVPSLPPSIMVPSTVGPPPKKPSASKTCLFLISTHVDEYVVDNAAGTHGATLGSDVLSRVGQSISSFEAPQWQFLNNARDCNTLYDKSVELATASLSAFAQLNYKLNNKVRSSMSYAQDSKDLQIKLADEFKAAKTEMEAEAGQMKSRIAELEKLNVRLEELEKINAKL